MASTRSVSESPYAPFETVDDHGVRSGTPHGVEDPPFDEWNPTEETLHSVRGRHRVVKQRGGGMARSGTVLGVGMVAAIGAGGMATAKEKDPAAMSVPDMAAATGVIKDLVSPLPGVDHFSGFGDLLGGSSSKDSLIADPFGQIGVSQHGGPTDAGEALRARILAQADQQQDAADQAVRESAAEKAAEEAARAASEAAAERRAAEAEARRVAEEAARKKAEQERLAALARSYVSPISSYQLSSGFGEAGSMWVSNHTGQDFAAPSGTPVKAVHTGTITEAGWAGSYGYRIVLKLADGTEVWYCHLSSMVRTGGQVTTGDVIGRVGSTGNSSGAHLHLEVRPGGGDPVDPLVWLRGHAAGV